LEFQKRLLIIVCWQTFIDSCDFYASATGILNRWKWPDIPGRETFKGKITHSANWDPELSLDYMKDKTIALIGAGSTGVQILPQIQPVAKRVDHYFSGKTWISPIGFGSDELQLRGAVGNCKWFKPIQGIFFCTHMVSTVKHDKEELEKWAKDPSLYHAWRHKIEKTVNGAALITIFGTSLQKEFQSINQAAMKKKLEKKPEIMEAMEPSWPPGCRRLTPGPGYLEALVEDNANFVTTKIKRFTPDGIETIDGKERKVDIIICATGFDTTLVQDIPIIGEDGISLNDVWDPFPHSYFGIFVPHMPNMLRFVGPNGAPGTGGFVHLIECACEYMIKAIQKVQREYIKSIVVKPEAMNMLNKHIDKYFTKTIYTQPCKSWMKRGKEDGRIITLWPGSAIHAVVAFDNPRWEDFDYTYLPETIDNRFSWLGKGLTLAQEADDVTTEYLDTVDKPPVLNEGDDPRRSDNPYIPCSASAVSKST
jgi:cation diffusion facilitator CzcD-associated flavoprotein CzcO